MKVIPLKVTKPRKDLDGKKFSTTIKRKYWEQKMEQVRELGYFYEYKQDSKFWRKRFNKLIIPCDGTFLVGSDVYRVRVTEVIRRLTSEFFDVPPPEIHTEKTWRLTCVLEESGDEDKDDGSSEGAPPGPSSLTRLFEAESPLSYPSPNPLMVR